MESREYLSTLDQRPEGYGDRPYETVGGISKNIGGVFKITPNLALSYSEAQNIAGGNRVSDCLLHHSLFLVPT